MAMSSQPLTQPCPHPPTAHPPTHPPVTHLPTPSSGCSLAPLSTISATSLSAAPCWPRLKWHSAELYSSSGCGARGRVLWHDAVRMEARGAPAVAHGHTATHDTAESHLAAYEQGACPMWPFLLACAAHQAAEGSDGVVELFRRAIIVALLEQQAARVGSGVRVAGAALVQLPPAGWLRGEHKRQVRSRGHMGSGSPGNRPRVLSLLECPARPLHPLHPHTCKVSLLI